MIPLLDLKRLNAPMQSAIDEAVLRVAHSGRYILGEEVDAFEEAWARYCGVKYCVGTANALESLELILGAYGIGPGDEVIVPANTYIATWLAVTRVGAHVVPVDVDRDTYNLDPDKVAAAVTGRTRAVLVVHLYGRCAPVDAIRRACPGLLIVEDAAQAHGASLGGVKAGALGDAAAFSFYPSKNLGALGDAGCVTTDDMDVARSVRRRRCYGGTDKVGKLGHDVLGMNSRLDEMQAAILRAKLPFLDEMNGRRRDRAVTYDRTFRRAAADIRLPKLGVGDVFHQYVVAVHDRSRVIGELKWREIDCHVHYPVPPHREEAYAHLRLPPFAFPVAEVLAGSVMSLPIGNDGVPVEGIAEQVSQVVCGEVV